MKLLRISLYGNFGAGNLGNECTLQTIIEQIQQRHSNTQLLCICTDPKDVRTRHNIAAFPSQAVEKEHGPRLQGDSLLRVFRIAFQRIPIELIHWIRSLRILRRTDMLIVAGTGILSDHLCGPLGWPYDIFKLSTLAALCRVKLVFMSVGAGPLNHPLSRWFVKMSLALAHHRSYRDPASKQFTDSLGVRTDKDPVYPDLAFALSPGNLVSSARDGRRRVVGVGIKDYGLTEPRNPQAFREYLDTMAVFVSWLLAHGYDVRLLIGDFRYDPQVIEQLLGLLKRRNIPTSPSRLIVEPAVTVKDLLRQVGETDIVISARYHNLVMALIQNKPIISLSDHPKLSSLATDLGFSKYLLPLKQLGSETLIARFEQLESESEQLKSHIKTEVGKYREILGMLYSLLFPVDVNDTRAAEPNVNLRDSLKQIAPSARFSELTEN